MPAPLLPVPKWLVRRVKLWMRRMRLDAHWELNVEMTENAVAKDGTACLAYTAWTPGYSSARMQFARSAYVKMTVGEVDRLICHELYHLMTARMDDKLNEDVGKGTVYQNHNKEMEHCAEFFSALLTRAYARKKE